MSRVVELHDQSPLVLQKDEMEDDSVFICRCGLSANWPYCDGSHAETQDETEGDLFAYDRDTGELEAREVDVDPGTFDPRT